MDNTQTNFLAKALQNLTPDAFWGMRGEEQAYENIDWTDVRYQKPSKQMVDQEVARLQAEYATQEYARKRVPEYPSMGDQLDALWKGGAAATEMLAKVQAVKAKYPKPEGQ